MSISFTDVVAALNVGAMVIVAIYALNQGFMLTMYLWFRLRDRTHQTNHLAVALAIRQASQLPLVTVQLPLYNERYVAERIITAVSTLDYPRHLLQIQVLDDSTDETSRIAQHAVNNIRERGVNIELVHRGNRAGYKAGALAHGLSTARGEFIAIFDADFIPPRDFLQRVMVESGAFTDPLVGFVQTRWVHMNRDASWLTRAQAILLDMCFVIDQTVRHRLNLPMQFNGSGGVWRRAAIDGAGGWQADTLTEDLDLSYRAQLAGWRGRYLEHIHCPGELPETLLAFKQQQARWARGGAQCARKLLPQIARSQWPAFHKVAAFIHITGYFSSVPVLLLVLISPLLALIHSQHVALPIWLSLLGVLPILELLTAQAVQHRVRQFIQFVPFAVGLSIGLALSETIAVLVGLLDHAAGEFSRTPKPANAGVVRDNGSVSQRNPERAVKAAAYHLRPDWTARVEMLLGLYASAICILIAAQSAWLLMLPVLFYASCYLGVAGAQYIPMFLATSTVRAQNARIEPRLPFMK
ncbi:MAG TPA: glycosyltransferase family 2 protein [Anaerolineae bacterium]